VRTYFLYAGGQLLAELDESGTLITSFTWRPTGLLSRTNLQTSREVWYLFDPQGNVAVRLDAAGQVLSSDQYDAWATCSPAATPPTPAATVRRRATIPTTRPASSSATATLVIDLIFAISQEHKKLGPLIIVVSEGLC